MNISKPSNAHRIYHSTKKRTPRQARETRATLGARFKILLLDAGLSPEQAGKMLHVTPRTIRYWISGKVLVPYAAYKLVRVMRLFELPCEGWDGWHMHSGRLWSPEGYSFKPHDANWWSLLVRRAEGFGREYTRANQLAVALQRLERPEDVSVHAAGYAVSVPGGCAATSPTDAVGRAAKPTGLNLSNKHFRTPISKKGASSLGNGVFQGAMQSVASVSRDEKRGRP